MEYEKLNSIVENCINRNEYKIYFTDLYKYTVPICKIIIKKINYTSITSNDFSMDYNLNDKLKLVSKFLNELDPFLYQQFETIMSSLDENQKPIVSFFYSKDAKPSYVKTSNGKVYINLKNNLNDIFTIIHEMIHCMNHYIVVEYEDGKKYTSTSYLKAIYDEGAPIIAEKLFGEWLIKNNYIKENDLNLRLNERLKSSKK